MEDMLLTLNKWAGTEGIDYADPEWGISYCFKWLVPKLEYREILLVPRPTKTQSWSCWIGRFGIGRGTMPESVVEGEETPALALCLAIEKLIGVEMKLNPDFEPLRKSFNELMRVSEALKRKEVEFRLSVYKHYIFTGYINKN